MRSFSDWLVQQGLEGSSQEEILNGYSARLASAGIPVFRLHVTQRAHHPEFGSIGFVRYRDEGLERNAFTHVTSPRLQWLASPLYHLLASDAEHMRVDLRVEAEAKRFPFLEEMRSMGATDYLASKVLFARSTGTLAVDPNNTPEGLLISWLSDAPDGFSERDIKDLIGLLPILSLALKSRSSRQMAEDLLATYLGKDAGGRVLSGEIQRGSYETTNAVIMLFDIQGFTTLTENVEGAEVVSLLNSYFGETVAIIDSHGGNVLKFMGDGLLAIFDIEAVENAHSAALKAAIEIRSKLGELIEKRRSDNLPHPGFNMSLHSGDVFYGNMGGVNRLDFTVIGSAVNTAARILGMCNPLERECIVSSCVQEKADLADCKLVSLGPYLLRGVAKPLELFAIYNPE